MRKYSFLTLLLSLYTTVYAQVNIKAQMAKDAPLFSRCVDSPKLGKQLTIEAAYVESGNSKSISFTAEGCKIKSTIKAIKPFQEETTFFVNGKPIRIFSYYDSIIETKQYGAMACLIGNGFGPYIYTIKNQKYLMVTCYAEKASGKFSRIEYNYFLPLDPKNTLGVAWISSPDMSG